MEIESDTTTSDPKPSKGAGCIGIIILFAIIGWFADMAGCAPIGDGAIVYKAEDALKSTLRDPSSYEKIDDHVYKLDDGGKRVVIEYRAKNGFGGFNVSSASYEFDAEGNSR